MIFIWYQFWSVRIDSLLLYEWQLDTIFNHNARIVHDGCIQGLAPITGLHVENLSCILPKCELASVQKNETHNTEIALMTAGCV
jgi:hypothetical protein